MWSKTRSCLMAAAALLALSGTVVAEPRPDGATRNIVIVHGAFVDGSGWRAVHDILGFRVPCFVRWPGLVKPGTIVNDVVAHEDWAPTLLAGVGDPDVKERLTEGMQADGKTFKVHLDGYDQTDLLSGKGPTARKEFFYFSDDGDLTGLRYDRWKAVFLEQQEHGLDVWRAPLTALRVPKIFDLHADPFERADVESGGYERWFIDRAFLLVPAQAVVVQFLASFREFPPRQRPASFSVDQALAAMRNTAAGNAEQ